VLYRIRSPPPPVHPGDWRVDLSFTTPPTTKLVLSLTDVLRQFLISVLHKTRQVRFPAECTRGVSRSGQAIPVLPDISHLGSLIAARGNRPAVRHAIDTRRSTRCSTSPTHVWSFYIPFHAICLFSHQRRAKASAKNVTFDSCSIICEPFRTHGDRPMPGGDGEPGVLSACALIELVALRSRGSPSARGRRVHLIPRRRSREQCVRGEDSRTMSRPGLASTAWERQD